MDTPNKHPKHPKHFTEERVHAIMNVLDVVSKLAVGLILVCLVWVGSTLSALTTTSAVQTSQLEAILKQIDKVADHDVRLATIEANRFSTADGANLLEKCQEEISGLRDRVEGLRDDIPEEVPPGWFVAEVRALEKQVEALSVRVEVMRDEVTRHVTHQEQ